MHMTLYFTKCVNIYDICKHCLIVYISGALVLAKSGRMGLEDDILPTSSDIVT